MRQKKIIILVYIAPITVSVVRKESKNQSIPVEGPHSCLVYLGHRMFQSYVPVSVNRREHQIEL